MTSILKRIAALLTTAVEIGAAARAGDKTAAIGKFQGMIDGCFGCHITYKDRVANVLRPADLN